MRHFIYNNYHNFFNYYFLTLQLAQKHRESYVDRSGTLKPVAYFNLPSSAEDQLKRNISL